MMRLTQFAPNEFYHVYNRGTEKRNIFLSRKDYDRFIALMYVCNGVEPVDLKLQGSTLYEIKDIKQRGKLVDIGAYCLMPNHFHVLLKELRDGGVSKFMQKLTTAYTMYFNKKNDRTGSLFQGKFKATHADDDVYLKYLITYIHLNPVKIFDHDWKEKGIKDEIKTRKFLEKYYYSSYVDYLGVERIENMLINKKSLPEFFEAPKDFRSNLDEWFSYEGLL